MKIVQPHSQGLSFSSPLEWERKGRRETLGTRFGECQGSVFPWTVRKCFDVSMDAAVLRLASLATVTQLISDL